MSLPQPDQLHRRRLLDRWICRFGPARSLALLLGSLTLLLVGCYALTERLPFRSSHHQNSSPPEISLNRMVRVRLLGRRPQQQAKLEITSPYLIEEKSDHPVFRQHRQRLATCTVRLGSSGGIQLGTSHYDQNDIMIQPDLDASLVVNGKTYRGLLRIMRHKNGLLLTNHVDIESYLRGVLRGELPRNFHPQSFKAQCVAARTYVLYQMRIVPAGRTFDVFDNEGSQVYIGVRGEVRKAIAAVEQTRGQVCVWNDHGHDDLFCTYYSSACGGQSQHVNNVKPNDPDVPPLRGGVACNDCYLARFYRWKPVKLSKQEITTRVVARFPSITRLGTIVRLRPKQVTPFGHIIRIQLDGSNGQNETLIGEDFRLAIGGRTLKSTNFVIETHPNYFVFRDGKGFGHGVGLCQNGMETKARRGMSYEQILAYYYPTSKIKTLYH